VATALPASLPAGTRWARLRAPLLLAAGVLLATVALHLRDPHHSGSWGYCPWLLLTGTYCPGDGGLRAVNDLSDGHLVAAASSNLLFVGSIPLLLFLWGRWVRDRWRGVHRAVSTRAAFLWSGAFLAVALGFAVLRNLPAGAWLAP
jgi:hypothetical protein